MWWRQRWQRRRRRWWHLNVKSVFCRDAWNCRRSILAPGGSIFVVSRGPSSWSKDWFSIFPWASASNSIICGTYYKQWLSLRESEKPGFWARQQSPKGLHQLQIATLAQDTSLQRFTWIEKKFSFFKTSHFSSGISTAICGYVNVWWSLILSSFFYK